MNSTNQTRVHTNKTKNCHIRKTAIPHSPQKRRLMLPSYSIDQTLDHWCRGCPCLQAVLLDILRRSSSCEFNIGFCPFPMFLVVLLVLSWLSLLFVWCSSMLFPSKQSLVVACVFAFAGLFVFICESECYVKIHISDYDDAAADLLLKACGSSLDLG